LRINPHADPNVIFRVNNYQMTVGALQDVGHECLAQAVGLSLPDFEAAIIAWAKGDGLPYGVLVPEMHICKPGDRTMTLCERIAAREAAINYSERMLMRMSTSSPRPRSVTHSTGRPREPGLVSARNATRRSTAR
jgi:hypothetical protein